VLLAYLCFVLLAVPFGALGTFTPDRTVSVLVGVVLVGMVYAPLLSFYVKTPESRRRGWLITLVLCGLVYGGTDFSVFREYFRKKGQDPPIKLIKLLYQFSPGTALELMVDLHETDETLKEQTKQRRDLIGTEEVRFVMDQNTRKRIPAVGVTDALNECFESPHWWVRLYAAEVALQTMDFDKPSVVERLKDDPEPIVREVIQEAVQLGLGPRGW